MVDIGWIYRLRFTGSSNYAWANSLVGGFPNFHHADYGEGVVNGTVLLDSSASEWRDVSASELGDPAPDDIPTRFTRTNDYAISNGFAGGFPNFHHAEYGGETFYGTLLIKSDKAQVRDILADVIVLCAQFTFESAITQEQVQRLLLRHIFARSGIVACGNLNDTEKAGLLATYRRAIWHGVSDDPGVGASTILGGSRIWVNFNKLFPQGDNEISQTLIHEMMHCAGYHHPERVDPPNPDPDVPGDNGRYYGTAPLRSEICIAGTQSLTATVDPRTCSRNGDTYNLYRR